MYPNQKDREIEQRTTKAIAVLDILWGKSKNRSHFYLLVCDLMFRKFDQHQNEIRSLRNEIKRLKAQDKQESLFS